LACRRSPCISDAERCSFEFCGGQRNSFPDQLKYPATPNLPDLTSIRQTDGPPKNIGGGYPLGRDERHGLFYGGAEKFAGHDYGHRRVRHVGVFQWLRETQNLGYTKLASILEEMGRPIPELGLRRIESGDRRVDVDDLMALAMALGVSPVTLLMPGVHSVGPRGDD
jgi:hypothetical protein